MLHEPGSRAATFDRAPSPLMRAYDIQTVVPGAGTRVQVPPPVTDGPEWNAYFPTPFAANWVSLKTNQPGVTDATGALTTGITSMRGIGFNLRKTPRLNRDMYLRHMSGTVPIPMSAIQVQAFREAADAYTPDHGNGSGSVNHFGAFGANAFGRVNTYLGNHAGGQK